MIKTLVKELSCLLFLFVLRIVKNTFLSESDRSKCGNILCIAETKV